MIRFNEDDEDDEDVVVYDDRPVDDDTVDPDLIDYIFDNNLQVDQGC